MTLHTALVGASLPLLQKNMYFSWDGGILYFNIKHNKSEYYEQVAITNYFVSSSELTEQETKEIIDICQVSPEILQKLENWQKSYEEVEEPCECECCGHQHTYTKVICPKISGILPEQKPIYMQYFHKTIMCLDTGTYHVINDVCAYGTTDLGGAWAEGEDGSFSWVNNWKLV